MRWRRFGAALAGTLVLVAAGCQSGSDIPRVTPAEAQDRAAGGKGLLVCAYEDEARCSEDPLAGAITLQDFRDRARDLPRMTPLVFYCS